MTEDFYEIFLKCRAILGERALAEEIGLDRNTIRRWIQNKKVPKEYLMDFYRILKIPFEIDKMSFKEKDQFYTSNKLAKYCINILFEKLKELNLNKSDFTFIEPSAGNGAFYNLLNEEKRIGLDIDPKIKEILKEDFLSWIPENKINNIIIGNPPFGLRGHMALRFINHSEIFADFVAFILPQVFESDGKGVASKRVKGFNLIHSEFLLSDFYYPDNSSVRVNTVFQIWAKNYKQEQKIESCDSFIKIYSLSDGGTPSSTRNKNMLDKCDIYLPSTCYGIKNIKIYNSFNSLPNRRGYGIVILKEKDKIIDLLNKTDWKKLYFNSTNSALNLRSSIIKGVLIKNKYVD